jgi:transposase
MCALLVGLPAVRVLGVVDVAGEPIVVHVELETAAPACPSCRARARVKERPPVELVDLPCFGRPSRLVWRKHRWCCPDRACPTGSWTGEDPAIAPARAAMTDRAGRWATVQVGREGRTVAEVARELGCDWHTVNDAVMGYGAALLDADVDRVGEVDAIGLDETLFARVGRWLTQAWCTSIVDVSPGSVQLLDVVPGRSAASASRWIEAQPEAWRAAVRYGVLDLSGPYRKTFEDSLDHVTQVADPFHLVRLANQRLDECRRRVQNETLGHRGRKDDPLYRARRLLTKAHERLDDRGGEKLLGLLAAGDPRGDVRTAWHAKEVIRSIYDIADPDLAAEFVAQLGVDLQDDDCPPEVQTLGRTLLRWIDQIVAWHRARVTNGPTEAMNNLIKRIKRIGFGFRRFAHYRIRVLLYAGRPNWDLLASIAPR